MRASYGVVPVSKFKKPHPALKHGAYAAGALLPGEDPAEFEKLHQALIAELAPTGVLEEDIVATIARMMWRKQNLAKFTIAELARKRLAEHGSTKFPNFEIPDFEKLSQKALLEVYEAKRKELDETRTLLGLDGLPELDSLMTQLIAEERLDGMIDKCLKRLLFVRGLKSISSPAVSPAPQQRITGHAKAA